MNINFEGVNIFAATGGKDFSPTTRPIIFVHGAAMDHTVWALMARWFAHHGRAVLALDLPTHGRSDGVLPDSIPALADWLWRLIDTLGIEKNVSLVGHSLGSLIALEASAHRPTAVDRLALLGCAVPMSVNADFLSLAQKNDPEAVRLMNDWSHSRRAHLGGNAMPGMWLVGTDTRLTEQAAPGIMYQGLKLCNDYSRDAGYSAAAKITCPTLFVIGEQDQMTPPKQSHMLAEKISDARCHTLPGCGHIMMAERPNETLDALIEFL